LAVPSVMYVFDSMTLRARGASGSCVKRE